MGVPQPNNPLALGVAVLPSAFLLGVTTVGVGSGLGAPVMQLLNVDANSLKKAIAVQMIVSGLEEHTADSVGWAQCRQMELGMDSNGCSCMAQRILQRRSQSQPAEPSTN